MMVEFPTACFVKEPTQIEELQLPHSAKVQRPYVIEKAISLSVIEYQNFIADICTERWFIDDYTQISKIDEDGIWHCIFVRQRGNKDGVLIMSEGKAFPNWAAYIPQIEVP